MNIVPDFSAVRPVVPPSPKEMLSVTRDGNQTVVRINSSSLGIMLSCLRKSKYVLEDGLKAKTEAPALTYGTAIHKALEVFYSHPKAARSFPKNFNDHSDVMAHGSPAPEKHFLYDAISAFVTAAEPLRGLPDTDMRSIPTGIYLLQHYFKTYINDPYVIHCDDKGPMTERFCEAVFHEDEKLKVILFGTIDFVLKHEVNGNIIPGDHKTTSRLGNDFFIKCKPNHQYSAYIFLAQNALGINTEDFIVNALQVKAKPLTARGTPPSFARQVTNRTPEDLEELRQSVMFAVRAYLAAQESGVWPMGHVNECSSYGGCQFHDVCSAPANLRKNILEHKFQTTKEI